MTQLQLEIFTKVAPSGDTINKFKNRPYYALRVNDTYTTVYNLTLQTMPRDHNSGYNTALTQFYKQFLQMRRLAHTTLVHNNGNYHVAKDIHIFNLTYFMS